MCFTPFRDMREWLKFFVDSYDQNLNHRGFDSVLFQTCQDAQVFAFSTLLDSQDMKGL